MGGGLVDRNHRTPDVSKRREHSASSRWIERVVDTYVRGFQGIIVHCTPTNNGGTQSAARAPKECGKCHSSAKAVAVCSFSKHLISSCCFSTGPSTLPLGGRRLSILRVFILSYHTCVVVDLLRHDRLPGGREEPRAEPGPAAGARRAAARASPPPGGGAGGRGFGSREPPGHRRRP